MRLRMRRDGPPAAPSLPAGWVEPRWAGRWTTLGSLDGPRTAAVDPAGLVTVADASWSLDWWIGGDDRWHLPSREVAVRQRLVEGAPVVETRLRVPSGDAVHRAYAARTRTGAEAVVVEIENQSPVPFAVALAVRPVTQTGPSPVGSVAVDGDRVAVDDRLALVLPRPPGRLALAQGGADAALVVLAGGAEPARLGRVQDPDRRANAALLFPLAHTATLRVAIPLGDLVPAPAELPPASEVAAGWSRLAGRAARLEVPDRRLRDAVAASTRHLLLAPRTPVVAAGLDRLGLHDEAATAFAAPYEDLATTPEPGRLLAALVGHWRLTGDAEVARRSVDLVAVLVGRLRERGDEADRAAGLAALPDAADLLDTAGQERAAGDVRRLAAASSSDPAVGPPSLRDLLAHASGTWSWPGPAGGHDPRANADLVTAVRAMLVDDGGDGLALGPGVPDAWIGQGWEVHGLPTRHGRLGYAVRWHGERPAVLWDLDRQDRPPAPLSAPRLDGTWSSAEARGEALLAPIARPDTGPRRGVTLPVTIEPLHRRTS